MELNIGKLIPPGFAPDINCMEKLESIVKNKYINRNVLKAIADPRMSRRQFEIVFKNELLALYKWSIKRIIFTANYNGPEIKFYKTVYIFLPRYAIAIHLLRRVIPFAIMGIKIRCVYAPFMQMEASRIMRVLLSFLGIADTEILLSGQPKSIVKTIDNQNNLIVVTGKVETLQHFKQVIKKTKVIGATGRCSILLANTYASAIFLKKHLLTYNIHPSCTTLKATFVFKKDFSPVRKINSLNSNNYSLQEVLKRLHPSIIYSQDYLPGNLRNSYAIFKINTKAEVMNLEGMGMDPLFGWPGDYFL